MKYITIILSADAPSFCYYKPLEESQVISANDLKGAIRFAMMENLSIQIVYPNHPIPAEIEHILADVPHIRIASVESCYEADILLVDNKLWQMELDWEQDKCYVVHVTKQSLFAHYNLIVKALSKVRRIAIIMDDISLFSDNDIPDYQKVLQSLSDTLAAFYSEGRTPQLNILSDRLTATSMAFNCNAGTEHITFAPNGRFYICPAFYNSDENKSIGTIESGISICYPELYTLDKAPICRHCDSFHCRRCVWLNLQMTKEVNTPGHQQCVVSHIERNASREMLNTLNTRGMTIEGQSEIPEINYCDPFEKRHLWTELYGIVK